MDARPSAKHGCLLAVLIAIGLGAYAVVTIPAARLALLAIALLIMGAIVLRRVRLARAVRAFRQTYAPQGKDLLVVYSVSPHWQPYIEAQWLPRWGSRAVLLNRSDPDWKTRPETPLWRYMTGPTEHTPAAIVVPTRGTPRVVRFYSAFKDHKHGRSRALQAKERELEGALESSSRSDV